MAKKNMRNEFEFMSAVLDALGVDYEEADIKVRERWRGKVLDGWGVSYIPDDVKQFERWRGKCIEGLSKGGGGETWRLFYEGTVTTEASGSGDARAIIEGYYTDADKIKVTFDGVEYILDKTDYYGKPAYGEFMGEMIRYHEYPFAIYFREADGTDPQKMVIFTPEAGTHTIKIETLESGGSNKFTIAKVTINFDGGNYPSASVGFIDPQNTLGLVFIETSAGLTYDVPLYDGKAFIGLSGANNGTVTSGDATWVTGDTVTEYGKGFIVTGDCVLSIQRSAM